MKLSKRKGEHELIQKREKLGECDENNPEDYRTILKVLQMLIN